MNAIMTENAILLGTGLTLQKGDRVHLTEATNIPKGGWFARPVDCVWRGLGELHEENSILLDGSEFEKHENL